MDWIRSIAAALIAAFVMAFIGFVDFIYKALLAPRTILERKLSAVGGARYSRKAHVLGFA